MTSRNRGVALALSGFVLGALVTSGAWYAYEATQPAATIHVIRESDISSSTAYTLTDPLITVGAATPNSPEYAALQNQVQQYLNSQEQNGLSSASVKFSDIYAAEGFTINPDETYDPASLTKVPLAIVYYELAENDPSILTQEITYSGEQNLNDGEQIESPVQLVAGQSYSVEDLIEHMIRDSDNNAEQLLADHLAAINELDTLTTLYDDLGIKIDPNNPDYMTVQSYSLYLRVLYNSTYLDRDYSEKLLTLMTQGDFTQGISAGVPNSITVAQKFGEARVPDQEGTIIGAELHNCGIVYYPNHPYILCVMTKGSDIPDLERVIAQVSQLAYQYIAHKYGQS